MLILSRIKTFRTLIYYQFLLSTERPVHFPCKNIAFVQAFLYLSSYPGNHLIVRIQLESTLVGDRSSGPVRHGKSGPPGILRSASFLRACPTVPEIEHCTQKIILTAISPLPFLTLCPLGIGPSGHVFGAKEKVLIHWI